jgi:hypothetical protein
MEEHFVCLVPCAKVDRITIWHSISFIYIAHVGVIIRYILQLNGLSLIAEITSYWCVMDVCQNTYVTFVPPQYRCQVIPSPYLNVALLECHSLGGLSPVACPSSWVWQCHNSKFVSWPSHRISLVRSNCSYTVCDYVLLFFCQFWYCCVICS